MDKDMEKSIDRTKALLEEKGCKIADDLWGYVGGGGVVAIDPDGTVLFVTVVAKVWDGVRNCEIGCDFDAVPAHHSAELWLKAMGKEGCATRFDEVKFFELRPGEVNPHYIAGVDAPRKPRRAEKPAKPKNIDPAHEGRQVGSFADAMDAIREKSRAHAMRVVLK